MKILFLSEFFPHKGNPVITGGSESRTYYLSQELSKMGHDVRIVSSNDVGPKRGYTKGGDLVRRFLFLWAVIWEGLKIDFDVVDGNNTATYLAVFILSTIKQKKGIYWVPDALGLRRWIAAIGLIPGSINAVNEWLSLHLSVFKIIALSETTKKILVDKFDLLPDKIKVLYPAVAEINQHAKHKQFTVISVNRLAKYKHNDLVIKALPKSAIYKIIGEGEERERLKQLARGKNIRFLGNIPHDQVLRQFTAADVFCLASDNEGFGIATLEAMGFGLPFINSNIPVHREIVQASQAGMLFDDDLAQKINLLMTDKNLYQQLSRNALAFAQKHTWARAAKAYEDLLYH